MDPHRPNLYGDEHGMSLNELIYQTSIEDGKNPFDKDDWEKDEEFEDDGAYAEDD